MPTMREWMDGAGDDDDDDVTLTFKEQKKLYEEMVAFAEKHHRKDVVKKGTEQLALLDECIKKEEEIEKLKEQGQAVSTENDAVSKEIEDKKKALDEQIKEIDAELAQLEDELTKALNANPRDEKLIAELQEQKKVLEQLKQECMADRKLLENCSSRVERVSQQCQTIYAPQVIFSLNAGGGSGFSFQSYFNQASFNNYNDVYTNILPSERTPNDECDAYLDLMNRDNGILEQDKELQQTIDNIKKTSAEVVQTLEEVKKDVTVVGDNINSRSEQLAAIRQAREARQLQSSSPTIPMTPPTTSAQALDNRPPFMEPMPDVKGNTESFKPS